MFEESERFPSSAQNKNEVENAHVAASAVG
jgi:hypothetical protein